MMLTARKTNHKQPYNYVSGDQSRLTIQKSITLRGDSASTVRHFKYNNNDDDDDDYDYDDGSFLYH